MLYNYITMHGTKNININIFCRPNSQSNPEKSASDIHALYRYFHTAH